ncbi:MAG TPA: hypothetical protein VGM63_01935 [Mucilaginibacter sp.]|jgi:hypothetical protein
MSNNISYLKLLIGKSVTGTEYNTSAIIPVNSNKSDSPPIRMSIFVHVHFEDYRLHIYNTIHVLPSGKTMNDFVGLYVKDAYETKEEAVLMFENDYKIVVDMRDEAYSDPEAMYLSGPDNFWTVWN